MPEPDAGPPTPTHSLRASDELRYRPSAMASGSSGGVGRRAAVSGAAAFALAMGLSSPAIGPIVRPGGGGPAATAERRTLDIVVAHTGETFSDVFAEDGRYEAPKLARLSRLLRDYATGEVKAVEPALLDLMARVQAQIGQPLRVLSGYRSGRTNRFMHIVGFDVAEHSLHIAARAVDFMVPGIGAPKLAEIAKRCGAGGIGVYRSGFVHIDTGPPRAWSGD